LCKFESIASAPRTDCDCEQAALENNGRNACKSLVQDRDVVLEAVTQNWENIKVHLHYSSISRTFSQHLPPHFVCKNLSLPFALAWCVAQNTKILAPERLLMVPDSLVAIVFLSISLTLVYLQMASEALHNDKIIMMEAIQQNPHAFELASEGLRGDKELVMDAITQDWAMLEFASKSMQVSKTFSTFPR
jgi:hypothetical protein